MIFKTIFAITGALLIAACANNHVASITANSENIENSSTGSLQGKVMIGPICPVETVDDPCLPDPSLYTSHKLLILNENEETVKSVDIDGQGNYRTELPPGKYTVDFTPHDIGMPGSFQRPTAEIRQGETTILNIEIDTGIR